MILAFFNRQYHHNFLIYYRLVAAMAKLLFGMAQLSHDGLLLPKMSTWPSDLIGVVYQSDGAFRYHKYSQIVLRRHRGLGPVWNG